MPICRRTSASISLPDLDLLRLAHERELAIAGDRIRRARCNAAREQHQWNERPRSYSVLQRRVSSSRAMHGHACGQLQLMYRGVNAGFDARSWLRRARDSARFGKHLQELRARKSARSMVEPAPIRPTRQMRPASGPSPAPISMPSRSSRCRARMPRRYSIAEDAGPHSASTVARLPAAAVETQRGEAAASALCVARAEPIAPRALLLRRRRAPRAARRRAERKSCGDTCAAASSPRAARDRDRSCAIAARRSSARGEKRDRREP